MSCVDLGTCYVLFTSPFLRIRLKYAILDWYLFKFTTKLVCNLLLVLNESWVDRFKMFLLLSIFQLCIQLSRSLAIYNPEPELIWVQVRVQVWVQLCMRDPHPEPEPMWVQVWVRLRVRLCMSRHLPFLTNIQPRAQANLGSSSGSVDFWILCIRSTIDVYLYYNFTIFHINKFCLLFFGVYVWFSHSWNIKSYSLFVLIPVRISRM